MYFTSFSLFPNYDDDQSVAHKRLGVKFEKIDVHRDPSKTLTHGLGHGDPQTLLYGLPRAF